MPTPSQNKCEAAAPDLLEACLKCLPCMEDMVEMAENGDIEGYKPGSLRAVLKQLRAAIDNAS